MKKDFYFCYQDEKYRINISEGKNTSNYNHHAHLFKGSTLQAGFTIKESDIKKDYLVSLFSNTIDQMRNPEPLF